ncbi:hypothetical protein Dsin_027388 [Dipteronia sinensis]|uniref:AAA+ ATPase domain-containing protein n=1 Tax=Dipteronia sinensis TaxID=43782 RepID=A0AAE0DUJ0_9ROSI|nr:hypothetical protein Dsin_027388 [Dipteronia sinensis]
MVEIAISIAAKVAEILATPVTRQFSYLWNYESNLANMGKHVHRLTYRRQDMQYMIDEARRNGELIEIQVTDWLDQVNRVIDEASGVIEDDMQPNMQCCNLKKRYQKSKKAMQKSEAIVELLVEGNFARVSYRTIPESTWLLASKGFEPLESRMSTLKGVLDALSNPDVKIVGLYGKGGVGKTQLAREVAALAKDEKLFDVIIFSVVSVKANIREIQAGIADQLGLKFDAVSESGRARQLYKRLKNERSVLLILDDIWGRLDLEVVGILLGDELGGCKLLLTSRSFDLLAEMDSQSNFMIDVLNDQESWGLFQKIAGNCVEQPDLQSIAIDVAKACGGLPSAIATIARALKNKSRAEWLDALGALTSSSGISEEVGVSEGIARTLQHSYDFLESEELKSTLLLCSIMEMEYTDDASVGDLLRCGMGLGIFQGIETIEEAQDRVAILVQSLKNSSLLLDTPDSEKFFMHDVVHDFVRSIASRDRLMWVMNDFAGWDGAHKDRFKNCKAISLHDIRVLPKGLECPELEFLYMKTSDPFLEVPDDFFTNMREVRVLHVIGMNLSSLPQSLGLLTNLHTLCMDQCELQDVAAIGRLQKLEILSFRSSNIEKLPKEIGQLTGLRLLDFSHCLDLEVIEPNLLSRLTRLEVLYASNTSIQWAVEGGNNTINSLYELKNLHYLMTIEIHIRDAKLKPEVLFSHLLKRYKIVIGGNWGYCEWYKKDGNAATLTASAINDEIIWLNQLSAMRSLVKNLTHLIVQGCGKVSYLFSDSIVNSFVQLQYLEICDCTALEEIIVVVEEAPREEERKRLIFPQLNHLKINDLESLRRFYSGNHIEFPSLKELEIENCPELHAFIFDDKVGLPNIEKVMISGMDNLKTIWHSQPLENSFCKLKSLEVNDCQKLLTVIPSRFCRRLLKLEFLTVKSCGLLEQIFDLDGLNSEEKHPIEPTRLRELYIDHLPNLKHIWNEDPQRMLSFQELQKVKVFLCSNLKNLFPSSVGRSLSKLESLEVSDCGVEEIVAKGVVDETVASLVFPELSYLQLHCLPELRTFYPGHTVEAPYLKRLGLHYCDKIQIFISEFLSFYETNEGQLDIPMQQPFFLVGKGFSMLEELQLSGKTVTKKWQVQVPERFFPQLKSLELSDDESTVLTLHIIQRFHNLAKLSLNSGSYQEIFPYEYAEEYIGRLSEIKHLVLNGLHDLKEIYGQDSKESLKFQDLEILEVQSCFNLINLMPSSASLQNLTILRVWGCEGLINIIAFSAAKSLLRLVEMEIFDCGMMMEIVANEDVTKDGIVFDSLKSLSLLYLRSLTCFYSGNCTLSFPSLENLTVNECPKMKNFSEGSISTPKLQKLAFSVELTEHYWEGDVNTTIQQYHKTEIARKKRLQ